MELGIEGSEDLSVLFSDKDGYTVSSNVLSSSVGFPIGTGFRGRGIWDFLSHILNY